MGRMRGYFHCVPTFDRWKLICGGRGRRLQQNPYQALTQRQFCPFKNIDGHFAYQKQLTFSRISFHIFKKGLHLEIDQWVSHYSDDEARNFVLQFEREICSWLAEKFCSFCRTSCGIENNCQDLKRENLSPPSFFILSKSFLFSFSEKKLHWEMIDVKSCTMPDHKIKSEKSKTKTQFVVFYPL